MPDRLGAPKVSPELSQEGSPSVAGLQELGTGVPDPTGCTRAANQATLSQGILDRVLDILSFVCRDTVASFVKRIDEQLAMAADRLPVTGLQG